MPVQPAPSSIAQVTFTFPGPLVVSSGNFVWANPFNNADIMQVQATSGRTTPAAASTVIFDVNYYNPDTDTWVTIYTNQANRPSVLPGEMIGEPTVPDIVSLDQGMCLTVDVDTVGGGATPTDEDFTVIILMRVD